MAKWPNKLQYWMAMQAPKSHLLPEYLTEVRVDQRESARWNNPWMAGGRFAVVFSVREEGGQGKRWALRFFTQQRTQRRARYQATEKAIESSGLDCFIDFAYERECIQIAGRKFPALRMEWVEGSTLVSWVGSHLDDSAALITMAARVRDLCVALERAGLCHGDLSGDNIMITESGEIRLVDYDSLIMPRYWQESSVEVGTAGYRHPKKDSPIYQTNQDRFPSLVICASLMILAEDPGIWNASDEIGQAGEQGRETLVFSEEDLRSPARSRVFSKVMSDSTGSVRHLANELLRWCDVPPRRIPELPAFKGARPQEAGRPPGRGALEGSRASGVSQASVRLAQRWSSAREKGQSSPGGPTSARGSEPPHRTSALERVTRRKSNRLLRLATAASIAVAFGGAAWIGFGLDWVDGPQPQAAVQNVESLLGEMEDARAEGDKAYVRAQLGSVERAVQALPASDARADLVERLEVIRAWLSRSEPPPRQYTLVRFINGHLERVRELLQREDFERASSSLVTARDSLDALSPIASVTLVDRLEERIGRWEDEIRAARAEERAALQSARRAVVGSLNDAEGALQVGDLSTAQEAVNRVDRLTNEYGLDLVYDQDERVKSLKDGVARLRGRREIRRQLEQVEEARDRADYDAAYWLLQELLTKRNSLARNYGRTEELRQLRAELDVLVQKVLSACRIELEIGERQGCPRE